MGSDSEMIPCLDFSMYDLGVVDQEGSEEWKKMSKKVREACESHGCFFLMCDKNKFPFENMLMGMKDLFDLPEEIKRKYTSSTPFSSYSSEDPKTSLAQTFGIGNAPFGDNAQTFTNLMWPQGNPIFWY
ncbi:putative non-heme dioxygenase domain, isopenicillin N synthase [Medicago truncatula]|uniref:2-oxoglutarate-dependent dioxygenase n=1 Tax=Medicago truncatula TaxID=3880 RepID=A0A072U874_MEDTR|nr:2-oxoglutarate-dependent dioxygenase AOP3 [Medicago truncatula]KEH25847.1 2-oxoglutarate-dependent dioxygenase [Medicago truncatula]RHN51017.1 putative non-heme dioxygenase domain, isopenicillin N synthase [Medicago truncatula]